MYLGEGRLKRVVTLSTHNINYCLSASISFNFPLLSGSPVPASISFKLLNSDGSSEFRMLYGTNLPTFFRLCRDVCQVEPVLDRHTQVPLVRPKPAIPRSKVEHSATAQIALLFTGCKKLKKSTTTAEHK